jgi:hypothetical protein
MALTYRGYSGTRTNSGSTDTAAPTLPANWANNDIAFLYILRHANVDPSTPPSGWNLIGAMNNGTTTRHWLYSRLLQTGDSAPSTVWAAADQTFACIFCLYGNAADLDTTSQTSWILASSNTAYATNDTNLKAAGLELSEAAPLLHIGGLHDGGTARTFTAPAGYTERIDLRGSSSASSLNVNQKDSDHDAGTVSEVSSTISATSQYKHAWLVAVKKAAVGGSIVPVHLLKSRYYPQGVIR